MNCPITCNKNNFFDAYPEIFCGLGCVTEFIYDIDLKEGSPGIQRPTRRIPYAVMPKVKEELDRMEKQGIISKVTIPTKYCSQMVVVRQKDKIRICIDPSDLNKDILRRRHPMKTIEEIATNIKGSKYFRKLDKNKGFLQILLSNRSRVLTTFSTPWGRYCWHRMPFGICSAPEVFQKVMEDIFAGIDGIEISADGILIHAPSIEKLDLITHKVMNRIKLRGGTLNKEKHTQRTTTNHVSWTFNISLRDKARPFQTESNP